MNSKNVLGMINFHGCPSLSPLTDHRPFGSTSFLGRYALIDFGLSNLCNSGIERIGVLVQDHIRSVLKHLGSMDSWTHNTKTGSMHILFNEASCNDPESNTDLNNIKANDWILYDNNADYVVIVPSHIIAPIDFRPLLEKHIANRERITVLATKIDNPKECYLGQDILSLDRLGYVEDLRPNDGTIDGPALVSMSAMIINRTVLADMIHQSLPKNPNLHLGGLIYRAAVEGIYKVKCEIYEGYSRCFDSFKHYMEYSFELFNKEPFDGLFRSNWPIFTITQNTPPSIYSETANVCNSFVSNGATVEGTVINSILCRNVKVAKGAVVKNSIIFSNSKIGEDAYIENALLDKQVIITRGHSVVGQEGEPVFIEQGLIV